MSVDIQIVIEHSEENSECGPCMGLVEFLATGKAATIFGQTRSSAELLALASSAGFDVRTGKGRDTMDQGGALCATVDGSEVALFWEPA